MSKDVISRLLLDTSGYDSNMAKARRTLDGFKKDNLSLGGVMKQMSGSLVGMAARFASVTAVIGAASAAIRSNIETARGFEKSMSQLSSLTGMVGKDLNVLKDYAIELGSKTTLSASQVADAFKLIGSQQPQLLSSASALKEVTQQAIRLSEAAGIELATASQTLSASINQMGGDSSNAARYTNVLAAASQKGAGDIAWLGESITKAATAAKAVGTDYEELVANLEQLAKAGFDASTAGTALRSIIMNLEKQSNSQFKPSVVGLTEAFNNMGKAQLTITDYQEIAGKMFATQAKVLAEAAEAAKDMTTAITGTNIAEEQAATNTNNLDGSLKSLSSAWEGLNLHINSSNGLLKSAVDWLKDVVTWADQAFTAAGRAQKRLAALQGGGNGEPTTVDNQINAILGLESGSAAQFNLYNATRYGYEDQIKGIQSKIQALKGNMGNHPKGNLADLGRGWALDKIAASQISEYEVEIAATEKMRDEFMARAAKILWPESGTSNPSPSPSPSPTTLPTTTPTENVPLAAAIPVAGSIDAMNAKIQDLNKQFNAAANDGLRMHLNKELEEAKKKLEQMKTAASLLTDPLGGGLVGTDAAKVPTTIPTFTDEEMEKAKTAAKLAEQNREAWTNAANAISSVGQALSSIEDPAMKVAGLIAQAIGNIALSYSQAMVQAAGTGGPWGWIAFAATGLSTMIGTIAAIKQATAGSYATGGIIPGNNYNDGLIANVSSGELILNRAQQNNLASQLQNNSPLGRMQLQAVISGEQIRLVLNNNSRRTGRGEYLTSR